jgi:hypothetical protein
MLLAVLVVMVLEWPKSGFGWARKSKLGFLVQTQLGDGRVEPRTGSGQGARVGYPLEKRGSHAWEGNARGSRAWVNPQIHGSRVLWVTDWASTRLGSSRIWSVDPHGSYKLNGLSPFRSRAAIGYLKENFWNFTGTDLRAVCLIRGSILDPSGFY